MFCQCSIKTLLCVDDISPADVLKLYLGFAREIMKVLMEQEQTFVEFNVHSSQKLKDQLNILIIY